MVMLVLPGNLVLDVLGEGGGRTRSGDSVVKEMMARHHDGDECGIGIYNQSV